MKYNRIMLGRGGMYADTCHKEGYIGADYDIHQDLNGKLPDNWRDFNKAFIPVYLTSRPEKTKVGAGLACGMLWTLCKGLDVGDIVLCPNGTGLYYVGRISGSYYYKEGTELPHRRPVEWLPVTVQRSEMSEALRNSTGSTGTCCDISKYQQEIESFINATKTQITVSDETVEDASVFALEMHLEDFLVKNWKNTLLGKSYDIFEEDGNLIGQQYQCDAGIIDILAVSKDKKTLLVIELKKGRSSDVVVGQILRYMGYVDEELASPGQTVKGIIIGLEDDQRLKWALSRVKDIDFYRYVIDFKLKKC